jgi:predicted HicB family RNase H-like nuclease
MAGDAVTLAPVVLHGYLVSNPSQGDRMAAREGEKLLGVRVPLTLHRRLKVEAARRAVSMAELVELALREFLAPKRGAP